MSVNWHTVSIHIPYIFCRFWQHQMAQEVRETLGNERHNITVYYKFTLTKQYIGCGTEIETIHFLKFILK